MRRRKRDLPDNVVQLRHRQSRSDANHSQAVTVSPQEHNPEVVRVGCLIMLLGPGVEGARVLSDVEWEEGMERPYEVVIAARGDQAAKLQSILLRARWTPCADSAPGSSDQ